MEPLPLRGRPENVAPRLVENVAGLLGNLSTSTFCFGCTGDPAKAKKAHGCMNLVLLYAGGNSGEAFRIEESLVKAFGGHSGYMEDVAFANGTVPPAGPCYVYLAVWQAGSDRRIPAL